MTAASSRSSAHGTPGMYNRGCRCDDCRDHHRRRCAEIRQRLHQLPADEVPHGTTGGHRNYGCRCKLCVQANADACRDWKARRAATNGTGPGDAA